MLKTKLQEKLNESLKAVLPIIGIVLSQRPNSDAAAVANLECCIIVV